MPYYRTVGDTPLRPHDQFRRPGNSVYAEELVGEGGTLVCPFVPRLFDHHTEAIPAPGHIYGPLTVNANIAEMDTLTDIVRFEGT
jgi:hypothetical protein